MTIAEFQKLIERIYLERDRGRGTEKTFVWFIEEIGELAKALGRPDKVPPGNLEQEFADVLAWLTTLASLAEVDLEVAAKENYGSGCPKCRSIPCACG